MALIPISPLKPRFSDFPTFRPLLSPQQMLDAGIWGKTLFQKPNKNFTLLVDEATLIANSKRTYNVQGNYTKASPLQIVNLDPTVKGFNSPSFPWALWYYFFYQGTRTKFDEQRIAKRQQTLTAIYAYLEQILDSEDLVYSLGGGGNPEITQLLLELGHPRNYTINGIQHLPLIEIN